MTLRRAAFQVWAVGVGVMWAAAAMGQPPVPAVRVSVSSSGEQANHFSSYPAISETGRFVTFMSVASNLVPGQTNDGKNHLFLHDRDVDADGVFDEPGAISTIRVDERPGVEPNEQVLWNRMTPDGRYVVFVTRATNLVEGGTPPNGIQCYRFDRVTRELQLISRGVTGEGGNDLSHAPDISDDGRFVVFMSWSWNLMPGDVNSENKSVYLRDMVDGTLTRLHEWPAPFGPRYIVASQPTISGDGTVIMFAERVITRLPNGGEQVEAGVTLINRATGEVRRRFAPGVIARLTRDGSAFVASENFIGSPPAQSAVYWQHIATGERRVGTLDNVAGIGGVSASGRYVQIQREGMDGSTFEDFRYRSSPVAAVASGEAAFSADERWMAVATHHTLGPPGQDTNGRTDIFVVATADAFDADRDGLDDGWERFFGLSTSAGGPASHTATGDIDNDGLTNAQELAAGSHPRTFSTRYLAEGATGPFFETRLALANSCDCPATANVRFEKSDGTAASRVVPLPARSRATVVASATVGATNFSTVIESDRPIAVDRLMTWDRGGYGSHAEASLEAASATWFLAEGTTSGGFQLFYLLQNPQAAPVRATVRFLLPGGDQILRTYDLDPRSRTTIPVNDITGLEATDVSGEVTASQPIVVERAMYRSKGDQVFALGHAAAGVPTASQTWFLAEGATGTFFDTYVLIANPSAAPATVTLDFLRQDGVTITETRTMEPGSRDTVFVDAVSGLEQTTFGARIQSTAPVVIERAMYWSGGFYDYYEGHVSAAATGTSRNWLLAEGEVGGSFNTDTYVLIANTSNEAVSVAVTPLLQNDARLVTVPVTSHNLVIGANSRATVALSTLVPTNSKAGVDVRQMDGANPALVVEGAIYSTVGGVVWSAGAALPATRF